MKSKEEILSDARNGKISWSEFLEMWEESAIDDREDHIPAGKPLGIFHSVYIDELKNVDKVTLEKIEAFRARCKSVEVRPMISFVKCWKCKADFIADSGVLICGNCGCDWIEEFFKPTEDEGPSK